MGGSPGWGEVGWGWGAAGGCCCPPPHTSLSRAGNAFCKPAAIPLGEAIGARLPPPLASRDLSRREARPRGGGCLPSPRGSSVRERGGGRREPPPPAGGLTGIVPRGEPCLRPAGWRCLQPGCLASSPGGFCLERGPEASGRRHLQPRRKSSFSFPRAAVPFPEGLALGSAHHVGFV